MTTVVVGEDVRAVKVMGEYSSVYVRDANGLPASSVREAGSVTVYDAPGVAGEARVRASLERSHSSR